MTSRPLALRGPRGSLELRPGDEAGLALAMLLEGEASGRELAEVLAEFGRSRSAYYEKLRRFREEGVAGLLPRRPGPRGPWRRSVAVCRLVVRTRLAQPELSAERIAQRLRQAGHRVTARSVARTLAEFGLSPSALARSAPEREG